MGDFDLSDALDSSTEFDEKISESSCFDMKEFQNEVFRLEEGLDLVVAHNRKTMQSVAKLVLVVNRMNGSLSRCGRELSSEELCSAIMDSVVNETIVKTVTNASTGEKRRVFQRANSERQCTLCDTSHKDIVQQSGKLKLQAITLKGGNSQHKVNFKMSRYYCDSPPSDQTVVLSITSSLHMSCSMEGDKAELKLEECSELDFKNDENMERFLFYKRISGLTLNKFESVKCRGWFISTSSSAEYQPVEMCREETYNRIVCFKVNN